MNPWLKHPVIYEIDTWVWLQELSQEYKSPVTLAKVPPGEVGRIEKARGHAR